MTFAQPFTDYEILDRVGAGAMGTVFKARHKKLNRIVALKVLKPSLARDSRYVDRLRREARIVASLNHPHIVTGYDLGEEGGYHFFVMEFVEGKSLRALLVEWGMFAEPYVLKVAQQVAQALDHAYQCSVIHRDIKPGNILIDEHGNVKLTDMGLAKGPTDMTLTRDGATVGTPQYISPEQARNPQDVDVRSDLYSLGATLYHMATGVPPFRGDTMAELITKVLHEAPVPPNELNPALSDGLSLVLRKLLAKDLRVRYQTPAELLKDLDLVQRALPPEVDAARLSAGEAERRPSLVWRSVAALATAALLGGAAWVGMQFRSDPVEIASSETFLQELDRKLDELATPGARLLHLRAVKATAPGGIEVELQRRDRVVGASLQAAVDDTAASFLDAGWVALVEWLRDPAIWPDRLRVEHEKVLPRLRERSGLLRDQLEPVARLERLDALLAAIDRELAERDAELLRRFEAFLGGTLPGLVDERLRASDFAGAERLAAESLFTFGKFARVPLLERLAEPTVQRAYDRQNLEKQRLRPRIDAAEAAVAEALRAEVGDVLRHLGERLAGGAAPDLVGEALARLRQDLLQAWPVSARFRRERDPWPDVDRQMGAMQQAVALALAEADVRRFEARCDLAWLALCAGAPADGLAVLDAVQVPAERLAPALTRHRRALQAAARVHDAMLQAMARGNPKLAAFPRSGTGYAVELRIESESGRPQLVSQAVGQPPRHAALTEFRFADLLAQWRAQGGDPFAGLPSADVAVGTAVFAMVGDEMDGVPARLQALGDPFLVEDVWPRIRRVRSEGGEAAVGRAGWFARLRDAHAAALQNDAALHELEAAIQSCRLRVPEDQRSEAERQQLRAASAFWRLASRRGEVLADLGGSAPPGAAVDVAIAGDELEATVVLPAAALQRGSAEGWELRGGLLEFAGGDRPWSELRQQQLLVSTGLDGRVLRSRCQIDFVLPPTTVGRRLYVVEFRGVAALVVLGANDAVYAALVDGDPRREEAAQRAFQDAIAGGLQPPKVLAVPGGVHRLTIDVVAPGSGRRALVKVDFEGHTLVERQVAIDPQRAVDLVLFPRQEIAVQQVVVRATGL